MMGNLPSPEAMGALRALQLRELEAQLIRRLRRVEKIQMKAGNLMDEISGLIFAVESELEEVTPLSLRKVNADG